MVGLQVLEAQCTFEFPGPMQSLAVVFVTALSVWWRPSGQATMPLSEMVTVPTGAPDTVQLPPFPLELPET
jgi:hypothetical protein